MLAFLLEKVRDGSFSSDVHFFSCNDLKILLDVNSGSLSIIDDITFDVLTAFQKSEGDKDFFHSFLSGYSGKEITSVFEDLGELWQKGLFLSYDRQETFINSSLQSVLKSICLDVTFSCNLQCRYCFVENEGFSKKKANMSLETGLKALDFLLKNSGDRKRCEIDFFGGEPLLNFEVVKKIVAFGKKAAYQNNKEIGFTLTTNGTLMNKEVQDFLNEENINVILSLDGRKEVNDFMRCFQDGTGSYDSIVPTYKDFIKSREGKNYYLRGTYTGCNPYFSEDVLHMYSLGFKNISLEPAVNWTDNNYSLQEEHKPIIEEEYNKLAWELLNKRRKGENLSFFHFEIDFESGPCLPKRLTACGAGYQYVAVAPNGEIYPCHQFIGNEKYILGDVWRGIINEEIVGKFKNAHIYNKICRGCWARFLCSGGCHASAVYYNNDIQKPHELGCFIQKARLQSAIYYKIAEKIAVEKEASGN